MREGYNKYEFGYVPNDWYIRKIGEIYNDLKAGATPSRSNPEYFEGTIPWITSGELKSKFIYDTYEEITEDAVKDTNLRIYPPGTFFIAITGLEAEGTRGSCGINGIPAATNQSCLAFQEKEEMNTEFLYYWYGLFGDYIGKKYTQGTKQQSLNNKIVEDLQIGFPKKDEQEKIVEILSTVDSQIDDTEKLIEKSEELKKGLMQKLLTKGIGHSEFKKTEVGEIPVSWEVKTVGECAEVTKLAGFEFTEYMEYKEDGEVIALRALNLKKGKLDLNDIRRIDKKVSENLKRSKLFKGNMLLSYVGTVGEVALIEEDDKYHLAPNVAKITFNNFMIPQFAIHYFTSTKMKNEINKYVTTTSQPALSMENIRKMKIAVPSIKEQGRISQVLLSLDNQVKEYENKKQKLEKLKKGLMQQLLTGKTRV